MLGIVPTLIGHTIFSYSLKFVSPTIIASIPLGEPIIASILAFILFSEGATSNVFIGGVIIAIGLIFWFRKNQQKTNELVNIYFDNCETGMNAMMDNFNKYQVETDRKIAELEKQIKINSTSTNKAIEQIHKGLPGKIRGVIGHIEFARPLDK